MSCPWIAVPLALVLAGSLALTGCSSGDEPDEAPPASSGESTSEGPTTPGPGATATDPAGGTAETEEPLRLTVSFRAPAESCFDTDTEPYDLAWFEVMWKAAEDLDLVGVELLDARGVRQIGQAESLSPRRFGARILLGGGAKWATRREVLESRMLSPRGARTVSSLAVDADETGLFALRLRFDEPALRSRGGASASGVTARYVREDGTEGEATVEFSETWVRGNCNAEARSPRS